MKALKSMSCNQHVVPLFKLPRANEIEKFINDNLKHDYVVRIEHTDSVVIYNTQWRQWGETRYAIKNSAAIIEDLYVCRARFSKHSIRLNAERIRPQTKMIFTVFRPDYDMGDEVYPLAETQNVVTIGAVAKPEKQKWLHQLYDLMEITGARVWRMIAIVGMLLTSLLLVEQIASS